MSLKKAVYKNNVILLVVPNKDYNKIILRQIKSLKGKKVCYVTTNKGHNALVSSFEKNNINVKDFFFIDCVTASITKPKIVPPNCKLISSPKALTELSIAVNKYIELHAPLIFIDSLSNLLVYHKPRALINFVHNLANKVRECSPVVIVLTIAKEDKKSDFFKKIQVVADEVIEV
ncbi:hypothetical protein ISS07_07015 [Candidatus Woesearchaeota archaeon]|nr:hypothetical protein [Candidatus Woesearchaeota archaeon]